MSKPFVKQSTLTTTFKRRCEGIATEERYRLGLKAYDPLSARQLVESYSGSVVTPEQFFGTDVTYTSGINLRAGWSAVLISQEPLLILYKPTHSPARQEADIMHEMGHYLLKHPVQLFDNQQSRLDTPELLEQEASYLGSCLQVPSRGLQWAIQQRWSIDQIAQHFGASHKLINWRCNMIGQTIGGF